MTKENNTYRVYALGNPLLEEDSLPILLLPRLRAAFPRVHFLELDPTENFPEEKHLILIDTIANATHVVVWNDIDAIQSSPNYSLHDFDLGMTLKLLKKMGLLQRVSIIGIPPRGKEDEIFSEVEKTITNLLSENESHN